MTDTVKIPPDRRFHDERVAYGLRFACEDCVHFLGDGRCAHEYPTEEHRALRYEDPKALLVFCREWELR